MYVYHHGHSEASVFSEYSRGWFHIKVASSTRTSRRGGGDGGGCGCGVVMSCDSAADARPSGCTDKHCLIDRYLIAVIGGHGQVEKGTGTDI
ncbi:hypothetical protein J6590_010032 [Homalodisca vitripennis]|nr:hypothetical protein J6590_010032 [Homalodisca vitripennis]